VCVFVVVARLLFGVATCAESFTELEAFSDVARRFLTDRMQWPTPSQRRQSSEGRTWRGLRSGVVCLSVCVQNRAPSGDVDGEGV